MSAIMTKRGSADNVVTYEFVCDSTEDLQAIDSKYKTVGSVAIIIQGDNGFEVYMANSKKEWINLATGSGKSSDITDGAASPTVDQGQADSMVLQE